MITIPKTMRAAAIDRFGGPEVLTIHELPVPEIDANNGSRDDRERTGLIWEVMRRCPHVVPGVRRAGFSRSRGFCARFCANG
jgi:hypothetical protein